MDILIIGSGGREHALGWKLRQSPQVEKIYFAPGNGGTLQIGESISVDLSNHEAVSDWAKENGIGLVVIGPDDHLAAGLSDSLLESGVKVFGPSRAAAEIEWSKSFAKQLMAEEGIPTAASRVFSDFHEASGYVHDHDFPVVIKADGLALGKGVVIAESREQALKTLEDFMQTGIHGTAGASVLIEEYLVGKEISVHAFCDGETIALFPASQDHKRINDGDAGPNTGGMGTIAPVPWITRGHLDEIRNAILMPLVRGLKKRGRIFRGVIFPGIMITKTGPKVIEFNARFGDPETQSYMPLLRTDLLDILLACADGALSQAMVEWNTESACCVVMASNGYPGDYLKDIPISGLEETASTDKTVVFHAGTKWVNGRLVTNGGRVLGVTTTDESLMNALAKAYRTVSVIDFEGACFRTDIGLKSLRTLPRKSLPENEQ